MTKFILSFALVLTGLFANASGPTVVFENTAEKVFTVSLSDFTGDVDITIFDWEGAAVFENTFTVDGISTKTFDASSLPNGKYIFIIADDIKEKATPFEITGGELNFRTALSTMTYTPSIQRINDNVYINAITNSDSTVEVVVEDEYDNKLYAEIFNSEITFGKVLDLSELPTGFYVVRVAMNNKNYAKSIEIK